MEDRNLVTQIIIVSLLTQDKANLTIFAMQQIKEIQAKIKAGEGVSDEDFRYIKAMKIRSQL